MIALAPVPGLTGEAVSGEGLTLTRWRFEPGTALPEHDHESAQITWVVSGRLELTVGGVVHVLGPNDHVAIAPWVPHSGLATEATEVLDAFTPERTWPTPPEPIGS